MVEEKPSAFVSPSIVLIASIIVCYGIWYDYPIRGHHQGATVDCHFQIVSLVDCYTHANLSRHGFKYYRTSLKRFFTHFPLRPITVFGKHCSPTKHLTYWYHPSTSPNKLPIVFLHGIGIGLYPYVNFLADLSFPVTPGEQPGVLAVELLPISFRLTADSSLRWSQLFTELRTILAHHKITRFILVSHSYGTALSTRLLHDPILSSQIDSLVLIDPICFLLHLPDVAYNFTRRKPQRANEWQLYYFASMDVGVAHSLGRNFFWSKCVLWREGLEGKRCTVSLSGRDLIVDTAAVRRYLTDGSGRKGRDRAADGIEASGRTNEQQHVTSSSLANGNSESERPVTYRDNPDSCISSTWISRSHRRTGLDVLWHPDLDHAQVFDHVQTRRPLVEAVLSYSCKEHDDQE